MNKFPHASPRSQVLIVFLAIALLLAGLLLLGLIGPI
jgi:hypothetical protein